MCLESSINSNEIRQLRENESSVVLRSLIVKLVGIAQETYRQRLTVLPTCMRVTNSGRSRASFSVLSGIILNYKQITGGVVFLLPSGRASLDSVLLAYKFAMSMLKR